MIELQYHLFDIKDRVKFGIINVSEKAKQPEKGDHVDYKDQLFQITDLVYGDKVITLGVKKVSQGKYFVA